MELEKQMNFQACACPPHPCPTNSHHRVHKNAR